MAEEETTQGSDTETMGMMEEVSAGISNVAAMGKAILPEIEMGDFTVEGGLSMVGGLADSVGGAIGLGEAVKGFHDDGIGSDEAWSGVGTAVNGLGMAGLTAGAALAGGGAVAGVEAGPLDAPVAAGALTLGGADVILGAGIAGVDAMGALCAQDGGEDARFTAGDVTGGLLRETIGDKSIGYGLAQDASAAVGGGALGTAAAIPAYLAGNTFGLGLNVADAVIGGVVNETVDALDQNDSQAHVWEDTKARVASAL